MDSKRANVLGLGNILMGDDAFGPYVVRMLVSVYAIPDEVSVMDVGTPGLDLIPFLSGAERLVIADTVRAAGRPGEVRLYRREDLRISLARPRVSPHDPGLGEALSLLELSGERCSSLLLVGVIPERVSTGIGLSPAVRGAVGEAVESIARELAGLGIPIRRRPRPLPAGIWWEAADDRSGQVEPACTR